LFFFCTASNQRQEYY